VRGGGPSPAMSRDPRLPRGTCGWAGPFCPGSLTGCVACRAGWLHGTQLACGPISCACGRVAPPLSRLASVSPDPFAGFSLARALTWCSTFAPPVPFLLLSCCGCERATEARSLEGSEPTIPLAIPSASANRRSSACCCFACSARRHPDRRRPGSDPRARNQPPFSAAGLCSSKLGCPDMVEHLRDAHGASAAECVAWRCVPDEGFRGAVRVFFEAQGRARDSGARLCSKRRQKDDYRERESIARTSSLPLQQDAASKDCGRAHGRGVSAAIVASERAGQGVAPAKSAYLSLG